MRHLLYQVLFVRLWKNDPMARRRQIFEGKAKVLFEGPEPGTLVQHFKDDASDVISKKIEIMETSTF